MKVHGEIQPVLFEVLGEGERATLVLNDLSTVQEVEDGYEWQQYSLELQRVAIKEEKIQEFLEIAKQKEWDYYANLVREKRNKLLADSDKYMAIDRLNLDTSSALKFLASLVSILKNNYAIYRKLLRDITEQDGFPYEVEWPVKPEE